MTNFDYDAHIKNEQIKANLTPEQLQELKDLYVERLVDNMSTKDLVNYVMDDISNWVNKLTYAEAMIEFHEYWDEYFTDTIDEVLEIQS